jgi:hypothetical protein
MKLAKRLMLRLQSGGGGWTPAEITTALWLDASDSSTITLDSSVVSQWADKSGNDRHATQSTARARPTVSAAALNGLNVLTFDGSNDFLDLGTVLGRPQDYTVFAVTRFTKTLSASQAVIASEDGTGASAKACATIASEAGGVGDCFWHYGDGTNYRWGYASGAITINTFAQYCLRHAHGVQNESLYKNGTIITNNYLSGAATAVGGTAQPWSIGRLGAYNGWYLGGNVAEIVVLLSAASPTDRQKVEGYLAHKWALTAGLPSDHLYKTTAP